MVDTDKGTLVRFTGAATYELLGGGGSTTENIALSKSEADQGLNDFVSQPQSWLTGGIDVTNGDQLGTSVPLELSTEGRFSVKLSLVRNSSQTGHPNAKLIYNITGGGSLYSYKLTKSHYASGNAGFYRSASTLSTAQLAVGTFFPWATLTGAYYEELELFIDNPAATTTTVTFNSIVNNQYSEPITVEGIEITKLK